MKSRHKAVLGALAVGGGGLALWLRRALSRAEGRVKVTGLQAGVEVLRDRWGVPHIYARSERDLFFAQGYLHAHDRLWQLELQRRLAAGRLAEIVGEQALPVDRFFRVLGLYRAAEAGVAALGPDSRPALEAYVTGVNAGIEAQRGRWPVEFRLLGIQPEAWKLADSLSWVKVMAWNLGCNWASELIRTRLAAHLGPELAADLEPPYPAGGPILVQGEGLPPGAASPPNGWGGPALEEALRRTLPLWRPGEAARHVAQELAQGLRQAPGNSNQWVVAGERTASGRPILANDTHLLLQLPAAWYQNHLCGGGLHVSGVSLPGVPGIVVGHNEDVAWGITIAWHDDQDLYVERLHPENPHRYEFQGGWLDAEVRREEIAVKGRSNPEIETVVVTRHGPIISGLVGEETPLALRWAALDDRDPLGGLIPLNRAGTWAEFRAAVAAWPAPSLNFVFADRQGNIGYVQAGTVPLRAPGDGLAPMAGWTGEHEWQGFLPAEELPQTYNPASGWLATSNHLVVGEDYPYYLSSDFENPARACRVADLVAGVQGLTVEDCLRFQLDTYSSAAACLAGHLLAVEPEDERQRRALDLLRDWEGRLDADSVAASICQVARLRALHLLFDGHLGELADAYVGLGITVVDATSPYIDRSIVRLLDLLDGKGYDGWLRDPESGELRSRQGLLQQALREALDLLEEQFGPDMARWTWGRLNRVEFGHLMGAVKPLNLLFNRGPYPAAGGQDTLLRASSPPRFPPARVDVGDALRFVADLSDWEACRMIVAGGQSGRPTSRHYSDLLALWREGHTHPMPFARDQVERHLERRLILLPG
jgi:penicillin G amidase